MKNFERIEIFLKIFMFKENMKSHVEASGDGAEPNDASEFFHCLIFSLLASVYLVPG